MDGTSALLVVFLGATLAASFVAGVSGFAFALIAAAVWLHVLTPLQTATLIVSYGMLVQGYGAWRLRHAVSWNRLWPFLLGGAPGVVIGASVLRWANPSHMRTGMRAGRLADGTVGFLSGMLGAMTGFTGILIVIWSGLRGYPKDIQRGVFQPASVALFAMSALAIGSTGGIAFDTVWLFLAGLPVLLAGTWLGIALYGRLDEAAFRRIVLILLLGSGVALIVSVR
jgi:uncharacterized membrane protein YfcA